ISLYMTMFSAWTFTGGASFVYQTSWFGLLYFATWGTSFLIGFLMSAKRWRRTRVTSPVEYIETRFNKSTHLFFSLYLALSMLYWPAHHLASLSKICAPTLFPGSMAAIDVMIVIVGIIIMLYTFQGGLWAVCITDVVQFLILIAVCLILIPAIFLSGEFTSMSDLAQRLPPLTFEHVVPDGTLYDGWYLLGLIAANMFGNAVGDKAQRYYSVRDENEAMKVGWLTFGLFCTAPLLFGIPPLVGKLLWPDIHMLDYFAGITKADENIFIAVVLRYMPAGIVGFFLSAMMAASMSSMSGVWNTVSSIISVDIYKNRFKPNATDKETLMVGRISIAAFALIAIGLALVIIHSSYGVFTFSTIFFGLTGIPSAIPMLLGIMTKKISRWSAMASVLAGALMASLARFILDYSLGQQFLVTVAVTLLFIVISNPLGRLYNRRRSYALAFSLALSVVLYVFCLVANNNPNLSPDNLTALLQAGPILQTETPLPEGRSGPQFLSSALFWLAGAALVYFVLTYRFAALFGRDLQSSQKAVTEFFKKLETPVDVEKEVMAAGARESNIFPLVGWMSMGLGGMSLLILIDPIARTNIGVNLGISGLLFIIGLGMILSKRLTRQFSRREHEVEAHP
ncbi:MAG: sodium:solute symporter family transporter, partial [Syntrophothermus sp.]